MREESKESRAEIELLDYLRLMWKWKYLIVGGTLICAISAWVISSLTPRLYRIEMSLQPGILKITNDGDIRHIDSPENIKGIIDDGICEDEILNDIRTADNQRLPKPLELTVQTRSGSRVVRVLCETSNTDLGLKILDRCKEVLVERYGEFAEHVRSEYDKQVKMKRTEIADHEVQMRTSRNQIRDTRNKIDALVPKLELVRKNRDFLLERREKLLIAGASEENILPSLFIGNTIQQNIQIEGQYMRESDQYKSEIERAELKLRELKLIIRKLSNEIKALEDSKGIVQGLQVLREPTKRHKPIRPRTKFNVVLSAVMGLFFTILAAFLIEALHAGKGRERS